MKSELKFLCNGQWYYIVNHFWEYGDSAGINQELVPVLDHTTGSKEDQYNKG